MFNCSFRHLRVIMVALAAVHFSGCIVVRTSETVVRDIENRNALEASRVKAGGEEAL